MPYKYNVLIALTLLAILFLAVPSCQPDDPISPDQTTLEFDKLSDYGIYIGNPGDLRPADKFRLYEISSELFSDHAWKQRLIYVPPGEKLRAVNDDLPEFPDGTIIVKTFFYYHDERDYTLGRKLVETRILQRKAGKWIAGTYAWNEEQTDAYRVNAGLDRTVNWIDRNGKARVLTFQVPSQLECRSCHSLNKAVQPIGPKVRNLNRSVEREGHAVNQLHFLHLSGILHPIDPEGFGSMPDYNNEEVSIEQRARAYLDANCAHCHRSGGSARDVRYRFTYEAAFRDTKIQEGKAAIRQMMERGFMPKIGTTVIDKAGVELINRYLNTL